MVVGTHGEARLVHSSDFPVFLIVVRSLGGTTAMIANHRNFREYLRSLVPRKSPYEMSIYTACYPDDDHHDSVLRRICEYREAGGRGDVYRHAAATGRQVAATC